MYCSFTVYPAAVISSVRYPSGSLLARLPRKVFRSFSASKLYVFQHSGVPRAAFSYVGYEFQHYSAVGFELRAKATPQQLNDIVREQREKYEMTETNIEDPPK